jgi:hypothetical protein
MQHENAEADGSKYALVKRARRMSDDIMNPTNQVRPSTDGGFHTLWHGQAIRTAGGRMRHFDTERDAWAFLAQCDVAHRILHNRPLAS